ncbi:phage tail protein [Acinetobacter sp. YH01020]|uniref:phage tail protein n=1 Tax=Acinetobacter sp. YH01020 TaxID=2601034 RepID=UPI0015D21685|nr:phage tail protein [Acinetobacter sp. YH01020]
MSEYYSITTNAGDEAIAKAISSNTKLDITHIAFGDGNGSVPTPSKSRTALIKEVHRQKILKYEQHPSKNNWIVVWAVIPSNIGGFYIREIGLIANNILISNGSVPATYKEASNEAVREYQLKFTIDVNSAEVVSLILDESLIFATQEWVRQNFILIKDIVNNLTTDDALKVLSAAMGKKLQDEKLNKTDNAASASKLLTARTISVSGDATGSTSFDGASNRSIILTLANSGVVEGTYGSPIKTLVATYNNKGLATAITEKDIPTFTGSTSVGLVPGRSGKTTTKYLREDGQWGTPPNTTYTLIPLAELKSGTEDTPRVVNAQLLKEAVQHFAPVQTSITGNAGSASTLNPGAKINGVTFTGDKDIVCGFGVNQKWYNELSRRAFNTIFKNTNPWPIFIEYSVRISIPQSHVRLYVNGELYVKSSTGSVKKVIIVGPGSTYELKPYRDSMDLEPDIPISSNGIILTSWEEYK